MLNDNASQNKNFIIIYLKQLLFSEILWDCVVDIKYTNSEHNQRNRIR